MSGIGLKPVCFGDYLSISSNSRAENECESCEFIIDCASIDKKNVVAEINKKLDKIKQKKKDNPLESKIERTVRDYAESLGFETYKFSSPAYASVPDCIFIRPDGYLFFIEFKRKGEEPTEAQAREHIRLRVKGQLVLVIDNIKDGRCLIDVLMLGVVV